MRFIQITQMSKILALFNQAGGVAKSTTTLNLGYHLSMRQHSCLLVDIDPQASLTSFMGLEPSELETTIYDALVPKDNEEELLPIHKNLHGMDLLPANIELANAEQELIFAELRELRLKQILEPVRDNYDFILTEKGKSQR
ncbi:chromosome partitioning protein, ParA family ATPase [Stanieria sp. NIES-3757]|nr:chromosome partitioning protein, ParA family ATPase [Stanieria sp. NIES-3757]